MYESYVIGNRGFKKGGGGIKYYFKKWLKGAFIGF